MQFPLGALIPFHNGEKKVCGKQPIKQKQTLGLSWSQVRMLDREREWRRRGTGRQGEGRESGILRK